MVSRHVRDELPLSRPREEAILSHREPRRALFSRLGATHGTPPESAVLGTSSENARREWLQNRRPVLLLGAFQV